jgi:hypothetical protein
MKMEGKIIYERILSNLKSCDTGPSGQGMKKGDCCRRMKRYEKLIQKK